MSRSRCSLPTTAADVDPAQFLQSASPGWLLRLEPLAKQRELFGEDRGVAGLERADLKPLGPGIHQPAPAEPGARTLNTLIDPVQRAVVGSDRRVLTHFSKLWSALSRRISVVTNGRVRR